ncbi:YteP [Schleiferilactobacillus shenzhenensis LY-73]|uniref:YteP n=1 Tax=Schleiferilactobacillus shenzhenensis LY-73 TaxID=1231336 RepID=U4TIY9_9LACO|nr:YteP [Schleiferilactobacillus shenzhenensis LY-73]
MAVNISTMDETPETARMQKKRKQQFSWKRFKKNWQLYVFILPTFVSFVVFSYVPMYGILIAFKDYIPSMGIWGSPWVGFKYFNQFFSSYYFWDLIKNTVGIQVYGLIVGFPLPIILALALNELKAGWWKKFSQTVTYAPTSFRPLLWAG